MALTHHMFMSFPHSWSIKSVLRQQTLSASKSEMYVQMSIDLLIDQFLHINTGNIEYLTYCK